MTNEIRVGIGEVKIAQGDVILSAYGVGSCVVLLLYDPQTKTGGLAHILLPYGADGSFKHPKGAIEELLRQFSQLGIDKRRIVAKITGGSKMFGELIQSSIGERNVKETKEQLTKHSIPLVAEDVYGNWGRTVFFNLNNGEVLIRSYRQGEKVI
jgi:chemotaxis protein CheD|uniref:Probable chemoreceptor glutamine deamidase CheD n=1 Tax=candidate division WOR-3 bacterium TaxID=2052148 RepID=A0A7V3VUG1_UNCW3